MDKVYTRTLTMQGTTSVDTVTRREGLDEINDAMMRGRRFVRTMSQISRTDFAIDYKDGRKVRLVLTDAPKPERTAVIYRRESGDVTGRVVTVKGKDYVLTQLTPADRPVHAGAPKGWKPTAYVTYWSVRDGERFGATRTAGPSAKPGTVGHALYHNAMDHANGTGA